MKFRTEIKTQKSIYQIGYDKPVLMIGSCFTDNIGALFQRYLFHVDVNPFGVNYNPISIFNGIQALLSKDQYREDDLGFNNELYFSFDHYTKFSDPDKFETLKKINTRFSKSKEILKKAGTLIITFGTAYIYEYKDTGQIVNNCHKIPDANFKRRMLTEEEIISKYTDLIANVKTENPQINVVFTLSPVRHIKDGFMENQLSKSTLLLAIHKIIAQFPEACSYFPAYEIMMDDLRDYRYYSVDLIHPNDLAITYIWQKFKESHLGSEENEIIQQLDPIIKALSHRPIHKNTSTYLEFKKSIEEKVRKLKNNFPFLNWPELSSF